MSRGAPIAKYWASMLVWPHFTAPLKRNLSQSLMRAV